MCYSNSQLCSNILQEIMEAKGTWWERYFQFWNWYYGMEWIYKKIPFWWPGRIKSKLLNDFCQYLKDNYVIIKKMADLSTMKHSPTPISFFSRENHLWRERQQEDASGLLAFKIFSHGTLSSKSCKDDGFGRFTLKNTHELQSYLPAISCQVLQGSVLCSVSFNIFLIVWMREFSLKNEWRWQVRFHWRWSWQSEETFDIEKLNFSKGEIQYTACEELIQKRALTDWQQ